MGCLSSLLSACALKFVRLYGTAFKVKRVRDTALEYFKAVEIETDARHRALTPLTAKHGYLHSIQVFALLFTAFSFTALFNRQFDVKY